MEKKVFPLPEVVDELKRTVEAWIHTGMAEPEVMAETTITVPEPGFTIMGLAGVLVLSLSSRSRARRSRSTVGRRIE